MRHLFLPGRAKGGFIQMEPFKSSDERRVWVEKRPENGLKKAQSAKDPVGAYLPRKNADWLRRTYACPGL